jgi:GDPmannose 4,6-dehydratase
MWLMLQQPEPADYVIATGETNSVGDLLRIAFHHVGINDWRPYVVQEARFFRPADVSALVGDATKARSKLGWRPQVDFQQLIEMMVDADLEIEKRYPGPPEGLSVPLSRVADADSRFRYDSSRVGGPGFCRP